MPHSVRPARMLALLAAAVLGTALPSCAAQEGTQYPSLDGARLEVVGPWSGTEQQRFAKVLRGFAEQTGAVVTYTSAHTGMPQLLDRRIANGTPPDVALLPQPGLLRNYAAAGDLVPLDAATQRVVRKDYAPVWRSLGSHHSTLYGVWFKAANKSLLWYDVAAFERAGIAPPGDLAQLPGVARALSGHGVAALSVGGKDRWTLTDWFENLYLQLSGPEAYDRLAEHLLPWTDPSVLTALQAMTELLTADNLLGGVAGALGTGFEDSVAKAFAQPPAAAIVMEGDFVASVVSTRTRAAIGVDVDAAPFPSARAGVTAIVGGGDVAVQLRRSKAGAALMRYLASPEAAALWAREGGYLSPNLELDLAVYPDPLTRSIARSMVEAGDGFRFDLSDLQPAAFGSAPDDGMQQALAGLLTDRNIWAAAQALERMAAAAFAEQPR